MIKRIRKLNKLAVVNNVALSVCPQGGVYYTNLVQDSHHAYGFNDPHVVARRIVDCVTDWHVYLKLPRTMLKPL